MKAVLILLCLVATCLCSHYYCPPDLSSCLAGVGVNCYDPAISKCCQGSWFIPLICGPGFKCPPPSNGWEGTCNVDTSCNLVCGSGYQCANPNGVNACVDINECRGLSSPCGSGYVCSNTPGSYTCTDVDECLNFPDDYVCPNGGRCVNKPGAFDCVDVCTDTNPCDEYNTCAYLRNSGTYACSPAPFYITSSMSNAYVIEPLGNASTPGTPLSLQAKVPNKPSQLWKYNSDLTIENVESQLVMDLSGAVGRAGTSVIVWTKKKAGVWADNQKWIYNSTMKTFKNVVGSVVLDVDHARDTIGANVIVWQPNKGTNQQFTFSAST